MLIPHKGHTDTIQVYSVTVMTHVKALQAGHSSQGTSEPITPVLFFGFSDFIRVKISNGSVGASEINGFFGCTFFWQICIKWFVRLWYY